MQSRQNSLALVLVIILFILPLGGRALYAANQDTVISQATAGTLSGGPVAQLSQGQVAKIDLTYAMSKGLVKKDDTTTLTLPKELSFAAGNAFDLKDPAGSLVAKGVINPTAKTCTLTYTDVQADLFGKFTLYVKADPLYAKDTKKTSLNLQVGSRSLPLGEILIQGSSPSGSPLLVKEARVDKNLLSYEIIANPDQGTITNLTVTDTHQGSGLTYKEGSLKIYRGKFVPQGSGWDMNQLQDVTSQYSPVWTGDKTGFSLNLGTVNQGFLLTYSCVPSHDPIPGEVFTNKASFKADGLTSLEKDLKVAYHLAGTQTPGADHTIKLVKTDAAGNPMPGYTYRLTRDKTGNPLGDFTTDAKGLVEFSGLVKEDYTLKEVAGPSGLPLDPTPITFKGADFASGTKLAEKSTQKTDNTVTVTGAKTWDDSDDKEGKRPESITIRLLADGTEVDAKVVSKGDDWKWTFANLAKTKDGKDIVYTLTEDPVDGYTTTITGHDITNTYTFGKASVQVTKVWKDNDNKDKKRPESVKIKLLADGQDTGKIMTLNEKTSWVGTFIGLEPMQNGKKIAYTVQEVDLDKNYKAAITGDADKGYTVTNTLDEKKAATTSSSKANTTSSANKTTSTTSKNLPKTGDGLNPSVYAIGLALLGAGLILASRKMKKSKPHEED